MKTIIKWSGEMAFSGSTPSGHVIKMDVAKVFSFLYYLVIIEVAIRKIIGVKDNECT
ncbi:hypothetical protein [Peribacillus sp. TH14]|uniref:hypothetical protein n=1 Tax=Peribacillus sp. TH14 TaxID=2798481 RepID=UPI001913B76A|nr:hypothetical protein [Peribacillus sp. TH14]MBK5501831.1 hypothetical protein [Peribacillus sp. TH14]